MPEEPRDHQVEQGRRTAAALERSFQPTPVATRYERRMARAHERWAKKRDSRQTGLEAWFEAQRTDDRWRVLLFAAALAALMWWDVTGSYGASTSPALVIALAIVSLLVVWLPVGVIPRQVRRYRQRKVLEARANYFRSQGHQPTATLRAAAWPHREEKRDERREVQRQAEEKTKRERQARSAREREQYGRVLASGAFGGRGVVVYDKGYVSVALPFAKPRIERLDYIDSSGNAQKKTALGRSVVGVATAGINVLLTPDTRGDVYLTIGTENRVHALHESPPTAAGRKAAPKLVAAGRAAIANRDRLEPRQLTHEAPAGERMPDAAAPTGGLAEHLRELRQLLDEGLLSASEYDRARASLLDAKYPDGGGTRVGGADSR